MNPTSGITTEQAIQLKMALEKKIGSLLADFSTETNLSVTNLSLDIIASLGGSRSYLINARVEL